MTVRSSGKQGAASEPIARFLWTPELDAWLLQQCAEARARGFTPDYMGMARSPGVSKDALRMHEAYLRLNKTEPPSTPTCLREVNKKLETYGTRCNTVTFTTFARNMRNYRLFTGA